MERDATPSEDVACIPDLMSRPWRTLPRILRVSLPGAALVVAYYLLSLFNSPNGTLGPDTGGKVATLKAMAANPSFTDVNVGYWAARWDPQGLLHPLLRTGHFGHEWVQVTTLPMLLAGEPLWRLGGYRMALLLPILGAVACAYAARALARRFGGPTATQWAAFWVIGLASPVTIYALDFWEHTIGLALMTWGTIALLDLLEATTSSERRIKAGLAGLAFGSAATMRTEALVYLAITATVVGVVVLIRQRRILPWILPGLVLVVGLGLPLVGNTLLDRWITGDQLRTARTAGAANEIGANLSVRLHEGLQITFGLLGTNGNQQVLTGVVLAVLIGLAVLWGGGRSAPTSRSILLLAGAGLLYLFTFINGLGWINGIVATAPLVAVGAVTAWRPLDPLTTRVAATASLLALPAIWMVRWTGGQPLQWSGRYVLCTMLVLVVVGVVALPSLRRPLPEMLVALSVAVTVFGLSWFGVHTHNVDRLFTTLDRRPEPVLVADGLLADFPREGGAFYGDHRWLVAWQPSDQNKAASVVDDAGFTSFGLVHLAAAPVPPRIGSFTRAGTTDLGDYQGVPIDVTSYRNRQARASGTSVTAPSRR